MNDEVIDATRWVYAWDYADRLVSVVRYVGVGVSEVVDGTVEYGYCGACDGALRERIERDESDVVVSWLRYEYEGLNLLRIDEVYDYDEDTVLEDPAEGDDRWRPLNVYTHGPGSIGQIIRNQTYSAGSPSTLIYYYYDALGNMLTYSYSSSGYGNFEMDAFGNRIVASPTWPGIDSSGPKEHLTGKIYDEDTGLYYFHARWLDPDVGRFVSRHPCGSTSNNYAMSAGNPVSNVHTDGGRAQASGSYNPPPDPNSTAFFGCHLQCCPPPFDGYWIGSCPGNPDYESCMNKCLDQSKPPPTPTPTPSTCRECLRIKGCDPWPSWTDPEKVYRCQIIRMLEPQLGGCRDLCLPIPTPIIPPTPTPPPGSPGAPGGRQRACDCPYEHGLGECVDDLVAGGLDSGTANSLCTSWGCKTWGD